MNELFDPKLVEKDSPKLAWMKRHGVITNHNPDISDGLPWIATDKPYARVLEGSTKYGAGNTEDEAITSLAKLRGWRLWNETV